MGGRTAYGLLLDEPYLLAVFREIPRRLAPRKAGADDGDHACAALPGSAGLSGLGGRTR